MRNTWSVLICAPHTMAHATAISVNIYRSRVSIIKCKINSFLPQNAPSPQNLIFFISQQQAHPLPIRTCADDRSQGKCQLILKGLCNWWKFAKFEI